MQSLFVFVSLVCRVSLLAHLAFHASGLRVSPTPSHESSLEHEPGNTTVVFFAGVEGSGHHLVEALMRGLPNMIHLPPGWGCGEEWHNTKKIRGRMKENFLALQPGVYMLPPNVSYPFCGKSHNRRRDLYHPRLEWISEVAQEVNVRLHVVQLHRKLSECLEADCIRRKLEGHCFRMSETLKFNSITLAKQLEGLAPGMLSCFRYGNATAMQNALEDAFGPENVQKGLIASAWKDFHHENLRASEPNWEEFEEELREPEALLERICARSKPLNVVDMRELLRRQSD